MQTFRIALYQPDIPGNTGTILRFAACLGLVVDIVEPAGFDISDRAFRRAGMDYLERAVTHRHQDWQNFHEWYRSQKRRLIVLSSEATTPYLAFDFQSRDILLFGRESSGLPDHIHKLADARLTIPMLAGARSINLAMSVAMVSGEAIRQSGS